MDIRQGKGTSSCSLHEDAIDFQLWQRCTPPFRGLMFLSLDRWVGGVHIYLHRRQLFAAISYTGSENLQMHTFHASGFLVICMAVSLAVSKSKNHATVSVQLAKTTGDVFKSGAFLCSVESVSEGGQIRE